jgi:hypothetical protein
VAAQVPVKPVLVMYREKSNSPDLFAVAEWAVMAARMDQEGIAYKVTSLLGKTLGTEAHPIPVDLRVSAVVVSDYSALLIPCYGSGDYAMSPVLLKLVADCHAQGLLVGAEHSAEALYQVGFSDGYNMAFQPGVVVDKDLVTAYNCPLTARSNGKPVDTDSFMTAFLTVLRTRAEAPAL